MNDYLTEFYEGQMEDLYEEARKMVAIEGKASVSLIQRKLKIGYARAAWILDRLAERGIVGPANGAKPREVLINPTTPTDL